MGRELHEGEEEEEHLYRREKKRLPIAFHTFSLRRRRNNVETNERGEVNACVVLDV